MQHSVCSLRVSTDFTSSPALTLRITVAALTVCIKRVNLSPIPPYLVNQARIKSEARLQGPDRWEGGSKRERRIQGRNSVLLSLILFIIDVEHRLFLLALQQPFMVYCALSSFFFSVLFFFSFWEKNITSSFSLCKWFLNSDCFYDSAMLKESKTPSQPSASVTCLHLTQGTAVEICSTIYWCIKILQEGHNIKSAAAVGIASSIWVVWLIW